MLGIKGYVRNTAEGIEALFIGEEKKVEKIIVLCKKGPKEALVKEIIINNSSEEADSFEIKY